MNNAAASRYLLVGLTISLMLHANVSAAGTAFPVSSSPKVAADIVVAQDGTGDYTTVQAAINAVPQNNGERRIIYIKNGIYNEHIRLANSFVTLQGENRAKTKIVWEINDARFDPHANADHQGIASFNLEDANDIILQSLTVENTAKLGGKPFVVFSKGAGTRIVIQDAEILGLGGDSLSLWTGGYYYHRNLHVTGTYHFVGPRGTCYMVDSVIECLGAVNNALFNEGMQDERQKFVLKNCRIVSKVPFGLGSNFRDAAWYFIGCQFPDTLKPEGKIFIAQSNVQKPQSISAMFKWATDRIYFASSQGPDYPWLKDNISESPAKTVDIITAAWTFSGEWDPESNAPPAVKSVARAGESIAVIFAESVTVKGRPSLILRDQTAAVYEGGSGTNRLSFRTNSPAAATKLELNGSVIIGNVASAQLRIVPDGLTLPAGT